MKRSVATAGLSVIGLFTALVLTLIVFRLPIVESIKLIAEGALSDRFAISRTMVKTIPLLMTGLGMVVAWRAGLYNIGGEGQFVVGGITAGILAKAVIGTATSPWIVIPALLLASAVGGSLWSWIPAWLYVRRGVEVVISTILLNFVALQLLSWVVSGPLQEAKHQLPLTDLLPDTYMLPRLDRQTDLHLGFGIAIVLAVLVYIFLFWTKAGFRLRMVGDSPLAARANKIDTPKASFLAMMVSGALCGLAGGIEYAGISGQLGSGFSQNWGFLGIPVALLSGLHPLTAILSALYFGALFAGSENLARFTSAGTTLIYVIQGIAVLGFVLTSLFQKRRRVTAEVSA